MSIVICHFCLVGPYNDGWNYQENILPKYHAKLGYKVYQIVTSYIWNGTKQIEVNPDNYVNSDGVNIIRLQAHKVFFGGHRFDKYPESYSRLEEINPDILFIHDVQTLEMLNVVKYLKKHKNCTVYADNHSDFSNSARNWISKNIVHKIIWRHTAQLIEPYVKTFYGVLPARVDFLTNVYKLPKNKCKLLVMGVDDELAERALHSSKRSEIRAQFDIKDDDFLIVSGGKIDLFKSQTLLLMESIKEIKNPRIKLLIFGSVVPELEDKINKLQDGKRVQFIGWIDAKDSYNYFATADLVCFPGRHSVFWEQVAGMGIPMIVKYWPGTSHIDCGGNIAFLYNDTKEEIKELIEKIMNQDSYSKMLASARKAKKLFLYSDIAKRSIE